MDPVIFTGAVPLTEFKADRPREYELLCRNNTLEERLVGAPHPLLVKFARIFGFTALFIGLSTVILIIYAMLFLYQ
jgi:hypothetical protein